MSGTLKAFLADYGSLLNINSRVSVVLIVVLLGVTRVCFFPCMVALLHAALRPMREIDATVSKKSVFFYIWGVVTARGLFIVKNICGLTNIYDVIFYFSFPCWFAP